MTKLPGFPFTQQPSMGTQSVRKKLTPFFNTTTTQSNPFNLQKDQKRKQPFREDETETRPGDIVLEQLFKDFFINTTEQSQSNHDGYCFLPQQQQLLVVLLVLLEHYQKEQRVDQLFQNSNHDDLIHLTVKSINNDPLRQNHYLQHFLNILSLQNPTCLPNAVSVSSPIIGPKHEQDDIHDALSKILTSFDTSQQALSYISCAEQQKPKSMEPLQDISQLSFNAAQATVNRFLASVPQSSSTLTSSPSLIQSSDESSNTLSERAKSDCEESDSGLTLQEIEESIKCSIKGVSFQKEYQRWKCTWHSNERQHQKYFSAKKLGFRKAKQLAIQWKMRMEKVEQSRPGRRTQDPRRQSGVKGVAFNTANRWYASWYDSGKQRHLYFSVEEFGFDRAKELAVIARWEAERTGKLPSREFVLALYHSTAALLPPTAATTTSPTPADVNLSSTNTLASGTVLSSLAKVAASLSNSNTSSDATMSTKTTNISKEATTSLEAFSSASTENEKLRKSQLHYEIKFEL